MFFNPLLIATAAPPIPEAKAWSQAYHGRAGPMIDLSQAVPGYPPHPEFLRRLGEVAASREAAQYGDILGDAALRDSYANHVSTLYGADIVSANVAITAGCNQAFFVAMIALARVGEAVMLPAPWYFNHKMALDMLGIEAVALPCQPGASFVPSIADARRLLTNRIRAIVLVTPNNPTGAVYPLETVAAFQALCEERGIALVIDETYRDFIGKEEQHGGLAKSRWADSIVQLYSFSKAYCIPGHRVGALVAGEALVSQIAKIQDTLQICSPRPAQMVLPWAIDALAGWRASNRDEIARRADALEAAVVKLDGWSIGSIGAYFAYLRHPFVGENDSEVCARLAVGGGVLCLPGSFFGEGQEGFLRVAFANVSVEEIAELPERIAIGSSANPEKARRGTG